MVISGDFRRLQGTTNGETMKCTSRNLINVGAALVVGALVLSVAGCETSKGDRTSGQIHNDKEITKNVERDLEEAPTFKFPDVKPNVYKGSVQLTGFVETDEQRVRAAEIASRVPGVTQVINNIMIKYMPTGRVPIRDPLSHEADSIMLDTNVPPPAPLRMQPEPTPTPPSETQPK
jgi:hyperosmotically inducible periplasmic protein